MAHTTVGTDPAPHDGSAGNLLQRAEPKVRVAGLVALLTPVLSFYLLKAVPSLAGWPGMADWADALIATLLTGGLTFTAGFLTKPVDRVDLFAKSVERELERVADKAVGPAWAQRLEGWLREIHLSITADARPALQQLEEAGKAISAAAARGTDPLVAARNAEPAVLQALQDAAAKVAADATSATESDAATAVQVLATNIPELADKAAEAVTPAFGSAGADLVHEAATVVSAAVDNATVDPQGGLHELLAAIHKALGLLEPAGSPDAGTPIADAVRADVPTAVSELPPVPPTQPVPVVSVDPATGTAPADVPADVPVDPPTTEIPAQVAPPAVDASSLG